MRTGDLDAVIVVPAGIGAQIARSPRGRPPPRPWPSSCTPTRARRPRARPSSRSCPRWSPRPTWSRAGRRPVLVMQATAVQTQDLSAAAYFVPSILAMALMQLGVFSAIPLVEQRQKLILKRLSRHAAASLAAGRQQHRHAPAHRDASRPSSSWASARCCSTSRSSAASLLAFGFVILGALTFIAIGYVIASFAQDRGGGQRADQRRPVPA